MLVVDTQVLLVLVVQILWQVNYDPYSTVDDGSCISPVYGCTDSLPINYNSNKMSIIIHVIIVILPQLQ